MRGETERSCGYTRITQRRPRLRFVLAPGSWLRGLLGFALVLGGWGCAGRALERDALSGEGLEEQIEVRVINNNFSDARLYAVHIGGREYMGTLVGKAEANYTLNWTHPQTLAIEISLLAGDTCTTEQLIVDPGDELFLSIDSVMETMRNCR